MTSVNLREVVKTNFKNDTVINYMSSNNNNNKTVFQLRRSLKEITKTGSTVRFQFMYKNI